MLGDRDAEGAARDHAGTCEDRAVQGPDDLAAGQKVDCSWR